LVDITFNLQIETTSKYRRWIHACISTSI